MERAYRIVQIMPADNWYVLLDCRNGSGDMEDEREVQYIEEDVVAFALCEVVRLYDEHYFDEGPGIKADDGEADAMLGEIHSTEPLRVVKPLLQNFYRDGVGVMCDVYESKKEDEFGKIVAMYKGKGNHRFKSIKFADEK